MGTWGEFISEMRIVNLKSQGIYVKVDDVLDLWEERNKLRIEVKELRDQLASEREKCALDVEEFAAACAAEPEQPEWVGTILQTAANLIRERNAPPVAEEVSAEEAAMLEQAPMAEEIPPSEEGTAPPASV